MGKVRVGTSTVAGLLTALAGFAAAVTAYKSGDRSEQTLGTIAGGTVGLIALVSTQAGRFLQAVKGTPQGAVDAVHQALDERIAMIEMEQDKQADAPAWKVEVPYHPDEEPAEYEQDVDRDEVVGAYRDLHEKVLTGGRDYDGPTDGYDPEVDGPGEDPPPQAALYPLTDPRDIPMDEGDSGKRVQR